MPCIITIHKDTLVVDARIGKCVDVVVQVELLELSLECSHGLIALGRGNAVNVCPDNNDWGIGSTSLYGMEVREGRWRGGTRRRG